MKLKVRRVLWVVSLLISMVIWLFVNPESHEQTFTQAEDFEAEAVTEPNEHERLLEEEDGEEIEKSGL